MGFFSFWFSELPKLVAFHYGEGNLNYPMIVYITLVHLVAIAGLLKIPSASADTLIWAFLLWPIR
jgi:stearoyl-CoA desaturase (Delta-9 desaturase)